MNSNKESKSNALLIALESELVVDIQATLKAVKLELIKTNERIREAEKLADANRLFNEREAMDYLRRDADTLAYYRTHGLESYKRGRDRWYRKGDIDAWLAESKVNRRLNV